MKHYRIKAFALPVAAALLLGACSQTTTLGGASSSSCTVTQDSESATIECDDGTSATVPLTGGCSATDADGVARITCSGGSTAEVHAGTAGPSALVTTTAVEPGSECAGGGFRVVTGTDRNGDGTLDDVERSSSRLVCNGAEGPAPVAPLVAISVELHGDACETGGTRIDVGADWNDNHLLDPNEVTSTSYVCNGVDGRDGQDGVVTVVPMDAGPTAPATDDGDAGAPLAPLVRTASEPPGDDCSAGGVRIDSGVDRNADGVLDSSEVTSSAYVCNGESAVDVGPAPVVTAYTSNGNVSVNSTAPDSVTLMEATLSAPGKGTVLAIGSTDAFCASPGYGFGYDCAASGTTSGFATITQSPDALAKSGDRAFFWLSPNTTENVTRATTFPVASAGGYTFYLRGAAQTGEVGFWRSSLTLLFIPDGSSPDAG